jgi:hypothetical protein
MASHQDSALDSALKNLDFELTLEIPFPAASGSSSCSPSISLGPVSIPLRTSDQEQPISGNFTKSSLIGNSLSVPTIGDPET